MMQYQSYDQYVVQLQQERAQAEKQRDEARAIARKLYAENEVLKARIDGAIKKLHELMEKYEIPYNIYLDFGDILADNFDQEETHE